MKYILEDCTLSMARGCQAQHLIWIVSALSSSILYDIWINLWTVAVFYGDHVYHGRSRQITANNGRSRQITADHGISWHTTANHSRSRQIRAYHGSHGRSRQITADHGRSRQITAYHGIPRQITADHGRSGHITAVTADLPYHGITAWPVSTVQGPLQQLSIPSLNICNIQQVRTAKNTVIFRSMNYSTQ